MPAINIVDRYLAVQYTGSNSAEIDSLITQLVIISEVGGVLTVESPSGQPIQPINTGEWVRYTQGFIVSVHNTSSFNNFFVENAVASDISSITSDISDLQDAVDDLENAGTGLLSAGIKESPLLLLGTSATVPVDVTPALPNTGYTPHVQLFASASALGSLSITAVSVVDTNTVNVTIQNSGLLNLGGVHILVTVTA